MTGHVVRVELHHAQLSVNQPHFDSISHLAVSPLTQYQPGMFGGPGSFSSGIGGMVSR
jgi:hypothetical protein